MEPALATDVLKAADNAAHQASAETRRVVDAAGLNDEFAQIRGVYSHHYPICIRRVLSDDTLIAMTSGGEADWYAFSFITYRRATDDFEATVGLLARIAANEYGARLHWGKWSPLSTKEATAAYPEMATFEAICQRFDPEGSFEQTRQ